MYREQLQINRQPFQDTIDTAFFFSGGKRREIVDGIKQALSQAVPLMILTGEEGAGKTMVCRMVEKELPVELTSVFLPRTVESFDDMVAIVAQEVNVGHESADQKPETADLIKQIVKQLKDQEQRLVIIFDEAEKIFLATLERIRKLIDQVNVDGIYFQILLSGRFQLDENLSQLSIVTFADAEERRFVLEPLGERAIGIYVNYCIKVATGESKEFFNTDAVSKIVAGSRGNFREINLFAQKYLQSENIDSSFMSLLVDVKEGTAKPRRGGRGARTSHRETVPGGGVGTLPEYLDFSRMVPRWVYYVGGACAVLIFLVVMFLFRPDSEEKETGVAQSDVPQIVLREVEPFDASQEKTAPAKTTPEKITIKEQPKPQEEQPEKHQVQQPKPATKSVREEQQATQSIQAPEADPVVLPAAPELIQTVRDTVKGSSGQQEKESAPVAIVDDSAENAGDAVSEPVAEIPGQEPVTQTVFPGKEPEALPSEKQEVEKAEEKEDVPGPSAIRVVKQVQPPEPVTILTEGTKKKPEETQLSAISGQQLNEEKDSTVLFRERLAAGARWLVGGGARYTVQLMVLTSENAEQNLVNMLKTKEYKDIADQLFVLRRTGSISTVMVFYGEYPTLIAARNARNNLPVFLRKHHPYAISVHGAVTKAQAFE